MGKAACFSSASDGWSEKIILRKMVLDTKYSKNSKRQNNINCKKSDFYSHSGKAMAVHVLYRA